MSKNSAINIFWFRRDLRLHDNAGLYHALKSGSNVQCVFIFDKNILDDLESKKDARVEFIHDTIAGIKEELKSHGSDLWVYYDTPQNAWKDIIKENQIEGIYLNRDYEPYAKERDTNIKDLAQEHGISFNTFKDHVIFESDEVLKKDGDPYVVFTPYKNTWMEKLDSRKEDGDFYYLKPYPSSQYLDNLNKTEQTPFISLSDMGFKPTDIRTPPKNVNQKTIKAYGEKRNFPAADGTSRLGIHYRFGTISIRDKASKAYGLSKTYLNELTWRDFYSQILDHYPHVVNHSFRKKYDAIEWRNDKEEFKKWCEGKTGYPIVDAGMRELNNTGYMHNRVRMITASFLTKHLLIDWRWGEAYFAEKLLDYELASNNGGWQWAAGSGTDAAPYFRIFNPWTQQEKFDKNKEYIKEWIPEYETDKYPDPIVDHKMARERCLSTYKKALDKA